jgi:multisubunit Na+/H+ antiporter MnhC subunit
MHLSGYYLLYQSNYMFKFILLLLVISTTVFSQIAFSACDATGNQSATEFLAGCSENSQGKAVITDVTGEE